MITRAMLDQLRQLLHPIRTQFSNVVARAVISVVNDDTKLQSVQIGVQEGQDLEGAERFQQYGVSSVPLPGAEAVVVCPMGDTGIPLVVATDDRRYRPTGLEPGEVALYEVEGLRVLLREDGDIEITAKAAGKVRIGDGGSTGALVKNSAYVAHKHGTGVGPSTVPDNIGTSGTDVIEGQ